MKKILIASNNSHKITEIKTLLKDINDISILSLVDIGINTEVIEDGNTLEENALIKAKAIYEISKIPCVSDDTGLFVDALNGEPGVYSARYAGANASYHDNCVKLLSNMISLPSDKRTAGFESVICFYLNEKEYYFFKGICKGRIISIESGTNGFGYDPLFVPEGYEITFAEMTDAEKNKISHRAKSLKEFITFLNSHKDILN